MRERFRMIFDLPANIQMAIRLRAVKGQCTTAEVINIAMEKAFPGDMAEAERELKEQASRPAD